MKERGKWAERREGYANHDDALRREFGTDMKLEELEAAGGLVDS